MKNFIYVISEYDYDDKETLIIGVSSSADNAKKLISEYYGDDMQIVVHEDIREDDIEFTQLLLLKGAFNKPYNVKVTVSYHIMDEL